VNGIDQVQWDPDKDTFITQQYDRGNFATAKIRNKVQLQKEFLLEAREDAPLFGFVGRLTQQKGLELILGAVQDMVRMPAQFVFLGIGDPKTEAALKRVAADYPEKFAVHLGFNEPLGHQIYAGSDFFLMPSEFEPCGLSQMVSLRYGTIPVVHRTGGLVDTIHPYSAFNRKGTGFVFARFDQKSFLHALQQALAAYADPESMTRLRRNAFDADFSWERSARQYQELYRCV
jgi:starch synthase